MRAFLLPAVAAGLLLAGCAGFQPLYGDAGVVKNLAAIQVQAPEGRTGYLIRSTKRCRIHHVRSCSINRWPLRGPDCANPVLYR